MLKQLLQSGNAFVKVRLLLMLCHIYASFLRRNSDASIIRILGAAKHYGCKFVLRL